MNITLSLPSRLTETIESEMYDKDEGRLRILLTHALRRLSIMETLIRTFQKTDPFRHYPNLSVIWDSAKCFYEVYKGVPSEQILYNDLQGRTVFRGKDIDTVLVGQILQEIYSADESTLNEKYANATVEQLRDLFAIGEVQRTITDDPENAKASILKVAATLKNAPNQGIKIIRNIFAEGSDQLMASLKKIPLYINFLQRALGGGMSLGEVLAFVIPSGGGKTTLALQLAEASVLARKYVLYCTFEQELQGDIYMRINILASGVPKSGWSKYVSTLGTDNPMKHSDFMDPSTLDRFQKTKAMWDQYFIFADVSDRSKATFNNIQQLFEIVEDFKSKGIVIDLLILDWWNSMVRRMLDNVPFASDLKMRAMRANYAEEFKKGCTTHGVRGIIFQQMNGEGTQRSLKALPSSKDAQDDKSFDNYFDYCFAWSKANPKTGVITVKADKVRSVASSIFQVTIDGEYCKILESKDPAHGMSLGQMLGGAQI